MLRRTLDDTPRSVHPPYRGPAHGPLGAERGAPRPSGVCDDEPAAPNDAGQSVTCDLQEWSSARKRSLEWMLDDLGVPFEWRPPGVLVAPVHHRPELDEAVAFLRGWRDH